MTRSLIIQMLTQKRELPVDFQFGTYVWMLTLKGNADVSFTQRTVATAARFDNLVDSLVDSTWICTIQAVAANEANLGAPAVGEFTITAGPGAPQTYQHPVGMTFMLV